MFNLNNLNDHEFELLCKDILEEKLNIPLYVFSRGVDQGIDICDNKKQPNTMIQVKHYIGSTYAQLKSSLKKEVPKVKKHNPKSYHVCTSQSLTRKNKLEIVDIFEGYIKDISYILDRNDISSFLEKEENQDIVLKNYKLWLSASNVLSLVYNQNVFIDCAELMIDIESQIKLFVETSAYRDSVNKLIDDNIIIIIGAPGVGKSTISKMVILYYASKGYVVRYVTSNDIGEIKNTISLDVNKKEIVLLDDFLGQHYLNLKDSQPNELKTLISYIEKSKSKKLILNSRITILNEAMQTFLSFRNIIEKHESNKYLIDLDKMSNLEKAEIFYNHLYFNDVPNKYLIGIKANKNYFKIIKHINYNPRIVEYVTEKRNYSLIEAEKYCEYIIQKLDNPEDVWRDEFRNRLDACDRILMHTLYSLTNTTIENQFLERAFNARIVRESNIDTSDNPYKNTIIRLTNSLLKNVDDKGIMKISLINPSINDYMRSELMANESEQILIIDNAVYFEQIFKMLLSDYSKEHYLKKFTQENLLKLKTLENSGFYYFIKSVVIYNIYEKTLEEKVKFSLERAYTNLNYNSKDEYGDIIYRLFTENFFEFYHLRSIFLSSDSMHYILSPLYLDDAVKIINIISDSNDLTENEDLKDVFRESLIEKITDFVQEQLSDEMPGAASNVIGEADDNEIARYMNSISGELEDWVWSELESSADTLIHEHVLTVNEQIELGSNNFDIPEMRYYLDIGQSIDDIINEPDYDRDDYREYSQSQSDDSIIITMFER